MDCMQLKDLLPRAIRGVQAFQYRKRYGLHAMKASFAREINCFVAKCGSFNTASGMDCMQYCLPEPLKTVNPEIGFLILSRPRDKSKGRRRLDNGSYAKTSQEREPKAKRDWLTLTAPPSLFALFPKPQGIFLSQKAVQKGCKASNIKETFVHEENLKLMTSFRKSRTSL